jgi:hypothetical protein
VTEKDPEEGKDLVIGHEFIDHTSFFIVTVTFLISI